jgi:hypothetical protein
VDPVFLITGASGVSARRRHVAFVNAGQFAEALLFDADVDAELATDGWREMVLTNVFGTVISVRAPWPLLADARGHIVLTGSVAGRVIVPGSVYSATKWAVSALGQSIRAAGGRDRRPNNACSARTRGCRTGPENRGRHADCLMPRYADDSSERGPPFTVRVTKCTPSSPSSENPSAAPGETSIRKRGLPHRSYCSSSM